MPDATVNEPNKARHVFLGIYRLEHTLLLLSKLAMYMPDATVSEPDKARHVFLAIQSSGPHVVVV